MGCDGRRRAPGDVLGVLGVVPRADRGVQTRRRHVVHVALPREPRAGELIGDVRHGGREDTAPAERLAAAAEPRPAGRVVVRVPVEQAVLEVGEELTVGLLLEFRALAGHHRYVVAVAQVRDSVVVADQRALRRKRSGEVRSGGIRAERDPVRLVFEHDDEHVLDRRGGCGHGVRWPGEREHGAQRQRIGRDRLPRSRTCGDRTQGARGVPMHRCPPMPAPNSPNDNERKPRPQTSALGQRPISGPKRAYVLSPQCDENCVPVR